MKKIVFSVKFILKHYMYITYDIALFLFQINLKNILRFLLYASLDSRVTEAGTRGFIP